MGKYQTQKAICVKVFTISLSVYGVGRHPRRTRLMSKTSIKAYRSLVKSQQRVLLIDSCLFARSLR